MKFLRLDSPIMQVLSKIADLMGLGLLALVCSLPLVTIGASYTAAHYVALKMVRGESYKVVSCFFKSFKQNFKQATIIWLLLVALVFFFAWDYYIITKSGLEFGKAIRIILLVIAALVLCIALYVFPVLAKFDNTIKKTIFNALMMALLQLPKTVLMVVFYALPLFLLYFFVEIVPLVLLFGISVPVFMSACLYSKFFKKIEDNILMAQAEAEGQKEEEVKEDDPDRIFSDKLDEALIAQHMDKNMGE